MMQKLYRSEYPGEFVIIDTVFSNGEKKQTREWVNNPIEVKSTSRRACCIAPGEDTETFPMIRLEKHPGGLLGRDRMQLYATETLWKKLNSDFLIVQDQYNLNEILEAGYQNDHIVYTSTKLCIENPGEFYLIPYGIRLLSPATALWLACFDGHKEIFMFGYNYYDEDEKIVSQIKKVMDTYNDVNFYHVTDNISPELFRRCINCEIIGKRDFVTRCDI